MYRLMAEILKYLKSTRAIKYVVWFHEVGVKVSGCQWVSNCVVS